MIEAMKMRRPVLAPPGSSEGDLATEGEIVEAGSDPDGGGIT